MKKELIARVRYNKGIPGGDPDTGNVYDAESFVLETYDEETNSWNCNTVAAFRRCVEYPDAKEKEFIHYGLLMDIFRFQRLGYRIHFCKAGEA